MKNLKDYLVPTAALFIICLVSTALLGLTNEVTAPIISNLAAEAEVESRKEVFPDAADFKEVETKDDASIVAALDENGSTIGYVIVNVGEGGYGGDISVMTGVTVEGTVTGVKVLNHNETPGLGAKSKNEDFRDQFKGLVSGITVSKEKATGNSIKAITGATKTSTAVANAVNDAIELAGGVNNG